MSKIKKHKDHYAVVDGSGAVKGFTWVNGLCGPTYLPSEAAAYAAAVEYVAHGYVPSWDKLSSPEKKNRRTILALANILSCPVYEIKGALPLLGESGSVNTQISGVSYDGEFLTVPEVHTLKFHRLSSGRIGEWELESIDSDSTSPTFKERTITTGRGQWQTPTQICCEG